MLQQNALVVHGLHRYDTKTYLVRQVFVCLLSAAVVDRPHRYWAASCRDRRKRSTLFLSTRVAPVSTKAGTGEKESVS